jgi:S-formylglutathione hydrolase FrmB
VKAAALIVLLACGAAHADPTHGRVVRTKFHSDALGVDKHYLVYLPAGYDASPSTAWPTFYYLNGLTGDETNWVDAIHLDQAADALKLRAIVVMPDGDDSFYVDSAAPIDYDACLKDGSGLFVPSAPRAAQCVRHRAYETYIVDDLVKHVDATYHTIRGREGRAIAGLSMGGFGAWMLALRHPDEFAATASHSGVIALMYAGPHPYAAGKVTLVTDPKTWGAAVGGIGTWVRMLLGDDLANWQAHDPASLVLKMAPGKLALYLDCGTEDDFALNDEAAYVHDLLTAHHIEHAYFSGPGHHDLRFWASRVGASLAFLRDHTSRAR